MLFFYLRHGDPIYDPDSLTALGQKQADALAKRLALYGIDRIYASTSNRAIQTAKPTCDLVKKQPTLLDFCNESHVWDELTIPVGNPHGGSKTWLFDHPGTRMLFTEDSMRQLSYRWYDHEELRQYGYEKGMERVYDGTDELFASLGYEHERYSGRYRVTRSNNERVALFAHRGFGMTFLSCLLDIPFPQYCVHHDMSHTGMTVIEFKEQDGYAIPKVLTHSSDSHLYREGLPTQYDYGPWF